MLLLTGMLAYTSRTRQMRLIALQHQVEQGTRHRRVQVGITFASRTEDQARSYSSYKYGKLWRSLSPMTCRVLQAVSAINTEMRIVTLENEEEIPYESLILATGGIPRRLPIDGADGENVFVLRGVREAKLIDEGDVPASLFTVAFRSRRRQLARKAKGLWSSDLHLSAWS
jgi:NADPH-dependent 2,4-dienoyl-CoA reductase/sulfur reductase-like enzyme